MISLSRAEDIFNYANKHSISDASNFFDISQESVKRAIRYYKSMVSEYTEIKDDIATVVVNTENKDNFKRVEDIRKLGNLGSNWEDYRIDYNLRADDKVQLKATFKAALGGNLDPMQYAEEFDALVKNYSPPVRTQVPKLRSNKKMLTISIFDFHVGKLSWHQETGADYDIHIARDLFLNYIDYVVDSYRGQVFEKVVLEVGGDFFNSDSPNETTVKGTKQSEDTRFFKTQSFAEQMMIYAIIETSKVAKDVHVMIVPGNHDYNRLLLLGRFLNAWFRNDDNVFIDDRPISTKMIVFGKVLNAYTHEKKRDMVALMTSLWPFEFGITKHRYFNWGHLHTRKDVKKTYVDETIREDEYGVLCVQHPTLVASDDFTELKGYVHIREALIREFDAEFGLVNEKYFRPEMINTGE